MKEVNPKETTRAYAFEMWTDAHMLTFFQKSKCYPHCPHQQTNRAKVQYADVLVCRKSGKRHQRVL